MPDTKHRLLTAFTLGIVFVLLSVSCLVQAQTPTALDNPAIAMKYAESITPEELSSHIYFLSSDLLEGRRSGSNGQRIAANYLASQYANMDVISKGALALNDGSVLSSYFQPFSFISSEDTIHTENVIAFLEGNDQSLKHEVIVITSHYDHLGIDPGLDGDQILNGAADNSSGTVAGLEMMEAFLKAKNDGYGPRRSILIAHFSGEELGTRGSGYYVNKQPIVPLDSTVAVINMDGIGGVDQDNPSGSSDYLYLVANDSLSTELKKISEKVNTSLDFNINLVKGGNWFSDHKSFEGQLVPFIYFSTGLTEHYHKPSDHASTIDYNQLTKNIRFAFTVAWQVANQEDYGKKNMRENFKFENYICPPCGCNMDEEVFQVYGACPACNMNLAPRWIKNFP